MKEELKAALMIAYPNFEGLAEWEPARSVADGSFVFADINTDRFDVTC